MHNKLSVRHLVIRSSAWVFGGQIAGQFLRLISNLIMTRLLVPEMFGVMAVANTILMGLYLCSYFGIEHNITQSSRGDERPFLDTAWVLQILRGSLLFLIGLILSVALYAANHFAYIPVHSAYADPSLPSIIAALSTASIIGGFESTKLATASRHMEVGKLVMINLGTQFLGLLFMVGLALIEQSIWAIVLGSLVSTIAKTLISHFGLPGVNNKFTWETRAFHELFSYGKWIFLTTIIGFFVGSSDKLILAGLIGPKLLGIYTIAIFMTNALQDVMSKWANSVVFPVLSKVYREKPEELIKVYYKFRLPFDALTLFLCGFLYSAGYIVIELLYDSRYGSARDMIEILSIGLLGSRVILAQQCYLAIGKPKYIVPMNLLQLIALFGLMVPAYRYYGMDGALYVISFALVFTVPLTWYLMRRLGLLDWKLELITLPALIAGYGFSKLIIIAYDSIKASFKFYT